MPEQSVDQEMVIAAPERMVGETDRPLRRIDTHVSHLFLGRSHVFKLKRAVHLPFADFTSPDARHRACQAELAVNKALAPDLYQAVLPITQESDGTYALAGKGQPVDWVVVMHRFADGALFSEMAKAGSLTPDLVREAAEVIARFHAARPPNIEAGHTADYLGVIAGLRRTEADGAERLQIEPGSDALFEALDQAVARGSPVIEQRRKAGWVRRGHGDLHLRNICLFERRVTPFDALEFDPRLATTDVLYDVAFLLMDLRERGLRHHLNAAMNAYLDTIVQPASAPSLLPLFMGLRAAVKMAVGVEAGDLEEAARYRRLGLELLEPARPAPLAIGGLSGSGKSTLARAVAPLMSGPCGARLLSTDTLRKSDPAAKVATTRYTREARGSVYDRLAHEAFRSAARRRVRGGGRDLPGSAVSPGDRGGGRRIRVPRRLAAGPGDASGRARAQPFRRCLRGDRPDRPVPGGTGRPGR